MSASKWFRGLRSRLLLLVAIPVAVLSLVAFLGIHSTTNLTVDLEKAALVRLPLATYSGTMSESLQSMARFLWTAHATERTSEARRPNKERVKMHMNDFDEAQKNYEALPRSEQSKGIYAEVPVDWKKAKDEVNAAIEKLDLNTVDGDEAARLIIVNKLRPLLTAIEKSFDELNKLRLETTKKDTEQAFNDASNAKMALLGISLATLISLVLIGMILASRLAKNLSNITSRIASSGDRVAAASEQLSAAGQTLSAGASEAASSLEETVSALEELSSMVKQNADNAKEAGALSQSARVSAEEGEHEIKELIGAMSGIAQSSKKIEEIINVIDDIAFQTNLLALNAAVEAARAGEQGKGFAVVAEAVRNLAQRSASAAKDITSLIKESVGKVEKGSDIADKSGVALKNIVTSVKKVADLNSEISVASQEQANGISQISQAMNQLDQATQSNAASAEEAASSSEEMSSEAVSLRGEVDNLFLIVEGKTDERVALEVSAKKPSNNAGAAKHRKSTTSKKGRNLELVKHDGRTAAAKAMPFDDEEPAVKISEASGF